MTLDKDHITRILQEAELGAVQEENSWFLQFRLDETEIPVFVTGEAIPDYIVSIAVIKRCTLDSLSAEKLRQLIRANSSVILAKIEALTIGNDEILVATSECAVQGITAEKLRRRLESCASLARDVRSILEPI